MYQMISKEFIMTVTIKNKSTEEAERMGKSVAGSMLQTSKRIKSRARSAISARTRPGQFIAFKQSVIQVGAVERISRIRSGIDATNIIHVSEYFKVSREVIGHIIGLSTSTMNRKIRDKAALSPSESERLERIAEIEGEAEEVFGDAEKAKRWLLKTNHVLGNTPLSMLDTDIGTGEVRKVLGAIAYGGVV
jgi:putative toxin-antitoxin system antitoxin component (TIGR02293 family)